MRTKAAVDTAVLEDSASVEDALREVENRSAMLRYFADSAAGNFAGPPEPHVFQGLADTLRVMQVLARRVRMSLDNEALAEELKRADD